MMRIRAVITAHLDDEVVAAYCRYHHIDPKKRHEAAQHMRGTFENVGEMGFDEQVHEGRQWLEHEAAGGREETFKIDKWTV